MKSNRKDISVFSRRSSLSPSQKEQKYESQMSSTIYDEDANTLADLSADSHQDMGMNYASNRGF